MITRLRLAHGPGRLALALGLALLPMALRADEAPAVKAEGASAWQALVGNTIVAKSKTGAYTEFFEADGTVRHVDADGKSKGKWALQGDKVCFDYADEDDHTCVTVQVTGSTGTFVDEDSARDTFDILPGNAKSL